MHSKLVFWDFDGVFVDSFNIALTIMKKYDPTLTEEEYRKRFEGNINDANKKNPGPSNEEFFKQYEAGLRTLTVTPGLDEALQSIAHAYPCFIISSTINKPIQNYLDQHGLSSYIREVLGNDVAKSKVEKFQLLLKKYEVSGPDCVFITDTLGDIKEAKKVDIHTIAVDWGFHPEETLMQGEPTTLLKNVNELPTAVQRILT